MSENYGWKCPRCQKCHSPLNMTCDCIPFVVETSEGTSGIVKSGVPQPEPTYNCPPYGNMQEQFLEMQKENERLNKLCNIAKRFSINPEVAEMHEVVAKRALDVVTCRSDISGASSYSVYKSELDALASALVALKFLENSNET